MIGRAWRVAIAVVSGAGCAGAPDTDLSTPADQAAAAPDLASPDLLAPEDLAPVEEPDLAPPADLAVVDLATPRDLAIDPMNPYGILFTDITMQALGGKVYGGRSADNQWGAGSGCAIADLDGDGRLDLVLARNDDPTSDKPGGPSLLLWGQPSLGGFPVPRYQPDPTFAAALAQIHAHGVAVGDYDGDGAPDLFIAAEGPDFLFHNEGGGHFSDVTAQAGVTGRLDDIGVGAVFADLNHDGLLDLYVVNWNPEPGLRLEKSRNRLYLNLGDGTFADVSAASHTDNQGCSHTAGVFDFDQSGDLGLYVTNDQFANDGQGADPSILPDAWYRLASIDDQGVPSFTDIYPTGGTKYARSGMGIAIADVDGDLTPDFYLSDIGKKTLYLNPHPGMPVIEAAAAYGLQWRFDEWLVGQVTWGTRFSDFDRDGLLDLWVNNGYFYDPMYCEAFHGAPAFFRQPGPGLPYEQIRSHVGLATFPPFCVGGGGGVGDPDRATSRGVVFGDLDGDGDDDVIVTPYGSPFFVYRNDTPNVHHALRLRLRGNVSSPDPVGATIVATLLSGRQVATFHVGGGDLYSQGDGVDTIGLGDDAAVARVEVRWPSGVTQRIDQLPGFALDTVVVVVEPRWLTLSARAARPHDPGPLLVYRPVDGSGAPLGVLGAGRTVTVTRSDGLPVTVTDRGDGSYAASLPHPGVARRTVLTVTIDGKPQRPRPMIVYR